MSFKEIDANEARKKYDNGTLFIDIREQDEWDEVRIPGARFMPLSAIQKTWQEIPKDQEIVLYCRSGNRSAYLISQLSRAGYDNLINLAGGIIAWYRANYPIEQE